MRRKFKAALRLIFFRRISPFTRIPREDKREKREEKQKSERKKKRKREKQWRKNGTIRKAFTLISANMLTGNVEYSGILPNA